MPTEDELNRELLKISKDKVVIDEELEKEKNKIAEEITASLCGDMLFNNNINDGIPVKRKRDGIIKRVHKALKIVFGG